MVTKLTEEQRQKEFEEIEKNAEKQITEGKKGRTSNGAKSIFAGVACALIVVACIATFPLSMPLMILMGAAAAALGVYSLAKGASVIQGTANVVEAKSDISKAREGLRKEHIKNLEVSDRVEYLNATPEEKAAIIMRARARANDDVDKGGIWGSVKGFFRSDIERSDRQDAAEDKYTDIDRQFEDEKDRGATRTKQDLGREAELSTEKDTHETLLGSKKIDNKQHLESKEIDAQAALSAKKQALGLEENPQDTLKRNLARDTARFTKDEALQDAVTDSISAILEKHKTAKTTPTEAELEALTKMMDFKKSLAASATR